MYNLLFLASSAAASGAAGNGQRSPWTSLIFMVVVMVGLVLIMVLPQKKREKQAREMLNAIKPGTRIRTIGGIYGTVTNVKEDLITIVSGPDQVKLVFVKGAIASIEPDEGSEQENTENTESIENTENTEKTDEKAE